MLARKLGCPKDQSYRYDVDPRLALPSGFMAQKGGEELRCFLLRGRLTWSCPLHFALRGVDKV